MKREVEIKTTPKELAELLFDLDNEEVAVVFSEWKKLFDKNYEEKQAKGERIWIYDLNHFMMYVIPKLDEDGLDFFRTAYATMIHQFCNDLAKKHFTKLN